MTIRLVLFEAAEADLVETVDWYNAQVPGLGRAFTERVEESLVRIEQFPEMHPIVFADVRRAVLHQFPYLIGYRLTPRWVNVLGVLPCRADPRLLTTRAVSRSPFQ